METRTKRIRIDIAVVDKGGQSQLVMVNTIQGKWSMLELLGVAKAIENKMVQDAQGKQVINFKRGGKPSPLE